MGSTKYEWTDKTKTGLSKEEYDALWDGVNAIGDGTIGALSDVTITSPANDEVLSYEGGDWINKTAAEAGLATVAALGAYLPLAGGSLTGNLMFYKDNPLIQLYDSGEATYTWIYHNGAGVSFDFSWNGVVHSRYMNATGTWELAAGVAQPTVNTTNAVSFYQDAALDELWATWKDSGATHHAPVARAKRSLVSLSPGMCTSSGVSHVVIGANTDVTAIQFPNGSTTTAAWSFTRPYDWDYGTIRVTVYWTNYTADVTGNHYWPQRLIGCQATEHLAATQTCNALISGAQTTTGLNNSSKIGVTEIDMGAPADLSNEAVMFYRIQRQGGHGSDTSGQPWEVIHITIKLITT